MAAESPQARCNNVETRRGLAAYSRTAADSGINDGVPHTFFVNLGYVGSWFFAVVMLRIVAGW
jgi:hypothetical protein